MAKAIRRGIPQKYSQLTKHTSVSLTPDGRLGLDAIASQIQISRSELVERIGRGLIKIIQPDRIERIEAYLLELKALYGDELRGRGLWRSKPKKERKQILQLKINQIEELLVSFKTPALSETNLQVA